MTTIKDKLNRPLHDLRISVTDRCNFRCTYCMPADVFDRDYPFLKRQELLSFEEITRVANIFVELGVRKLRITGGEPLLRKHIEDLIKTLSRIPQIEDICITTNAVLLSKEKSQALKDSGLKRITVSLDSMDDKIFQYITDTRFTVDRILQGIDNAHACGLQVKVNAVIKKGVNDQDILRLAQYFHNTPHVLRFIEYMDVGTSNQWQMQQVVPAQEIIQTINKVLPLQAIAPNYAGEVSQRFRYSNGQGEVGVITSITQPFCSDCTRARISAKGDVYTCLFAQKGFPLKPMILSGASDAELRKAIKALWEKRSDRYSELRQKHTPTTHPLHKVEMSHIGG